MKTVWTILGLILVTGAFAQDNNVDFENELGQVKEVSLEVIVDSAEEIRQTFKIEDLQELMELTAGKSAKLKITCRGEQMSNGKYASMSYEVEQGELSEKKFLKLAKKIRKSAIKYYNNN